MCAIGVDLHHPEAYRDLAAELEADDGFDEAVIYVIEEGGEPVAFYDLRERGDHVELIRMFQRVSLIGSAYGRRLWEHCVVEAAKLSDRMLIMSDPGATGSYEAMGARLERTIEVVPGLELGVYWYELA